MCCYNLVACANLSIRRSAYMLDVNYTTSSHHNSSSSLSVPTLTPGVPSGRATHQAAVCLSVWLSAQLYSLVINSTICFLMFADCAVQKDLILIIWEKKILWDIIFQHLDTFWRMDYGRHTSCKICFLTLTTALRSSNKCSNDGNEKNKRKLIQIKNIEKVT